MSRPTKAKSPTTRSIEVLELLRTGLWSKVDPALEKRVGSVRLVEKVEWHDPRTHRSHDFAGMFDLLYFADDGYHPGVTVYGVQVTSTSNAAARRAKIDDAPRLHEVEAAGIIPVVWSWRKLKAGVMLRIEERAATPNPLKPWGDAWEITYDGPGYAQPKAS